MESTLKSGKFDVKLSQEYKDKLESIEKSTLLGVQVGLKRKKIVDNDVEEVLSKVVIVEEEEEEKKIEKKEEE